jgi:hypothetical protein
MKNGIMRPNTVVYSKVWFNRRVTDGAVLALPAYTHKNFFLNFFDVGFWKYF